MNYKKRKMYKSTFVIMFISVFSLFLHVNADAGIRTTRHNLSANSPYSASVSAVFDATDTRTTRVCIYCHTPHNVDSTQAPLWGHMSSTVATYTVWSTIYGGANQPTGISRKCLSCHDGTVAIGALINGDVIPMQGSEIDAGTGKLSPASTFYLGTDITSHFHPISFDYDTVATAKNIGEGFVEFKVPLSTANQKNMLDSLGRMQCHSCHDPHNDYCDSPLVDDPFGDAPTAAHDPLWRKVCDCNTDNAVVCGSCHFTMRVCPDSLYDD